MGFQLSRKLVDRMINLRVSDRVGDDLFTLQVRGDGREEEDWLSLEVIHFEPESWAIGVIDPEDPDGDTAAVVYVRRGFDKAWAAYGTPAPDSVIGESASLREAMALAVVTVASPWSEG
jgi:hypothetical protein